jgi:hypothetical protein
MITYSQRLQTALSWAAEGFHIFPIIAGTKNPAINGWPKEASREPEKIKAWSDEFSNCNFGVVPGLSGHFALDLDVKNPVRNGIETIDFLEVTEGPLPATRMTLTPSGGVHLFLKGQMPTFADSLERPGPLGPGVDERGGSVDGAGLGYVLLPGSVLADGATYTIHADSVREIAAAPDWIIALGNSRKAVDPRPAPEGLELDLPWNIERTRDVLRHRTPAIEGQGGDCATNQTFNMVFDLGVSFEIGLEMAAELWNPRCEPPWSDEGLRYKALSAWNSRQNAIGCDALASQPAPASVTFADAVQAAGREVKAQGVKLYTLDEVADRPPPEWLIDGILIKKSTALLGAPMGNYKSIHAADMALAVATGRPAFGTHKVTEPGLVIYLTNEDFDGIIDFMRDWCRERGIPADSKNVKIRLCETTPQVRDGANVAAHFSAIRELAAGEPVALVLIDTFSKSFGGLDENSSRDMKVYTDMADAMVKEFGCAVLTVVHQGANTDKVTRGSTDLPSNTNNVMTIKAAPKAPGEAAKSRTATITWARIKGGPEPLPLHTRGRAVERPGRTQPGIVFYEIAPEEVRQAADKGRGKDDASRLDRKAIWTALRAGGALTLDASLSTLELAEKLIGDMGLYATEDEWRAERKKKKTWLENKGTRQDRATPLGGFCQQSVWPLKSGSDDLQWRWWVRPELADAFAIEGDEEVLPL